MELGPITGALKNKRNRLYKISYILFSFLCDYKEIKQFRKFCLLICELAAQKFWEFSAYQYGVFSE